ncbi:MAG: hypothetical protein OXS33_12670 [bacterium]|nr:hypothetical protein [bacterium]
MGRLRIEQHEDVPLWVDEHGIARVVGTRVQLEMVAFKHQQGHTTPQSIAGMFDTLNVEDVERILQWYRKRREDVDAYMEWCDQRAEQVRREVETHLQQYRPRHERKHPQTRALGLDFDAGTVSYRRAHQQSHHIRDSQAFIRWRICQAGSYGPGK